MTRMQEMSGVEIARQIACRQAVYNRVRHKVGTVAQYNTEAGWMKVDHRVFSPQDVDLYLPFRLITRSDAREVHLALPHDVLQRDYSALRPHVIRDERTGEGAWDERRITPGLRVCTVLGASIGTTTRDDPVTGWLSVEVQPSTYQSLSIPVILVDSISSATGTIFLAATREDLLRRSRSGARHARGMGA